MAATAHDHSTDVFTAGPTRPRLQAVRGDSGRREVSSADVTGDQRLAEEPLVGRAATVGAALGFAVVAIGIAVAGITGGMDLGSALGSGPSSAPSAVPASATC
jgi:hypothetical protein